MGEDKVLAILEKRAEKLSRSLEEKQQENVIDVLKFQLQQEVFAIEIQYVVEVCLLKEFTQLPSQPPFVFGLMNLRRQVFSIIDLGQLLEINKGSQSKKEHVIILQDNGVSFAICTNGILGVESIPGSILLPCPPTIAEEQSVYMKGITTEGVAVLDGRSLINSKKVIVDEEVDG